MGIARDSAISAASKLGVMVLSLASGIVLSRVLGAGGRGEYIVATSLAGLLLVNVANLGLRVGCQVFAASEPKRLSELHALAILVSFGAGAAVAVGLWVFHEPLQDSILKGMTLPNLLLVAAGLPFLLYQEAWRGLMDGLGAVAARSVLELIFGATQSTALVILLLLLGDGPVLPLVAVYYALFAIGCVPMLVQLRRRGALWRWPSGAFARQVFRYSRWVYVGNFAASAKFQLDGLLVNTLGNSAVVGVYNQASSLSNRVMLVPQSLSAAAYRSVTTAESGEAARLVASGVRQLLLIGVALSAMGWVCAPLIPMIYGAEFAEAIWPFRALLVSICLVSPATMIAVHFSGHLADPVRPMIFSWAALLMQVAGGLALGWQYGPLAGITGGTAASNVALLLMFVVAFLRRPEAPPLRDLLVPRREDFQAWARFLPRRGRPAPPAPVEAALPFPPDPDASGAPPHGGG